MRSVLPILTLFTVYSVSFAVAEPKDCIGREFSNGMFWVKDGHWSYLELFPHGKKQILFCFENFTFQGSGQEWGAVTCLNGQFMPDPACISTRCKEPPLIDHGRVKSYSKDHDSTVKYECEEGFHFMYNSNDVRCLFGEWKGDLPICEERYCVADTFPNGSYYATGEGNHLAKYGPHYSGEKVFVRCDDSFTFQGSGRNLVEVTCSKGRWKPDPMCNRTRCKDEPPLIDHGRVKHHSKDHGSVAEYKCSKGFSIPHNSPSKVQCLFGEWKGVSPRCQEKSCFYTVIPNGGFIKKIGDEFHQETTYGPFIPGEKLYLVCNDQYTFRGGGRHLVKVICSKGQWKPDTVCIKTLVSSCKDRPPSIDHGRVKAWIGLHNTSSSYECEEGFVLKKQESSKVRCLFGEWKGVPPKCDSRCYNHDLQKTQELFVYDGFTSSGEYMDVTCLEGFTIVDDSKKPYCSEGDWIQAISPCREKNCEYEPPSIDHGRFKPYSKDHNSTVQYECEERFFMRELESTEIRCLFGEWKGVPPKCQDNGCSTSKIQNGGFYQRIVGRKSLKENFFPVALNRFEYGDKLFVVCEGQFTFHGNGLPAAEVKCSEGNWNPEPMCLRTDVIIRSSKLSRRETELIEGEPIDIYCDSYYRIGWEVSDIQGLRVIDESRWVGGLYLNRKTLRLYPAIEQHGGVYKCGINGTEPRSIEIKVAGCGQRSNEMDHQRDPLQPFVVGGTDAEENSWPWMVSVYQFNRVTGNYFYKCGGSVLTPTHVLSAAHCYTKRGGKFAIRWGSVNMSSPVTLEDKGVLEVLNVRLHEQYRPRSHYHDIAVLLVEGRMETTPVCLPHPRYNHEGQLNTTLTGWGHTSYGGTVSGRLQEVELQVVDQASCREAYALFNSSASLNGGIEDIMLCATADGKDACQSDSGSPLVTLVEGGRWVQIGVVSFGYRCAEPGFPGVYAKIAHYADWIRRAIRLPPQD